MRRGTPLVDLSYQFGISVEYASSIFFTVLRKLKKTFESKETILFRGSLGEDKDRPDAFKPFPDVKVIIDGAELKIQSPSNYKKQGNTWSSYKHHNTAMFLNGVSCHGAVIFVSRGFEGAKSVKDILNKCGLKNYLIKCCDV
ncbi:Alsin [Frankliniella fusca]|uniref:Alsin n=1 Tax=Frankliniella fusca TaxID=407009 RepID=A0AAE1HGW8_9NEOP|nr:Alsin [Frankliniella fusca]